MTPLTLPEVDVFARAWEKHTSPLFVVERSGDLYGNAEANNDGDIVPRLTFGSAKNQEENRKSCGRGCRE
jgi:hypothetical protein